MTATPRPCRRFWPLALLALAAPANLAAAPLAGLIQDEQNRPVAQAELILRCDGRLVAATRSAADGRFDLGARPEGLSCRLEVVGKGFATQTLVLESDQDLATIRLLPGSFAESVDVVGTQLVGGSAALERLPGSYDRVEPNDLRLSQVSQFNEALRKVPSLVARDEEGFGLRPNIGLRGLNPTRSAKVLLLEDGLFLTFAPYGDNASYYHPPVERFETIEVVKGAGQIAYGPSTTGGVINYLTPEPPRERLFTTGLTGGDRDYLSLQAALGNRLDRFSWRVDLLHKSGQGARDHVESEVQDFSSKWLFEIDERQSLSFKASAYAEDSQVTYSGLTLAEYLADPRQNVFENDQFDGARGGVSARYALQLGPQADLTTTIYGSGFDRDWWRQSSNSGQRPNDRNDPKCGGLANLLTTCGNEGRLREYQQAGLDQRARFSFQLGDTYFESEAGARFHNEVQERLQKNGDTPTARDGVIVENNRRETEAMSGFTQNRILFDHLTLSFGLRFESIEHSRLNRLGNGGLGAEGQKRLDAWVPGIGLSYSRDHRLTFFAGAHRGFAPPRAEDVVSQTGGIIDLDAEESWIYELGLRAQPRPGVELSLAFFRSDYSNQIVPASLAGGIGSTLTNGGETLHQGLEGSLRLDSRSLFETELDVFLRLSFSLLDEARFEGERFSSVPGSTNVKVTGNRLPYAPERGLTAALGYRHSVGLSAQVEATFVDDQFGDDLNTIISSADGQRGPLPSYTTWNAALTYDLEAWGASVFATVKNLTDELAIADRSRGILPIPPRQFQVGLRLSF